MLKKYIFFIFISLLTIFFILINYFITEKKIIFLITILYLILVFFVFFISYKDKVIFFVNDIKSEIKNICWPGKNDISQTGLIIIIIILLTSIVIWLIDSLLTYIISIII